MTTFTSQDREAAQAEVKKRELDGEPIPFFGWLQADTKALDTEKKDKDHDRA